MFFLHQIEVDPIHKRQAKVVSCEEYIYSYLNTGKIINLKIDFQRGQRIQSSKLVMDIDLISCPPHSFPDWSWQRIGKFKCRRQNINPTLNDCIHEILLVLLSTFWRFRSAGEANVQIKNHIYCAPKEISVKRIRKRKSQSSTLQKAKPGIRFRSPDQLTHLREDCEKENLIRQGLGLGWGRSPISHIADGISTAIANLAGTWRGAVFLS